ncbi:MAG TPA: glycosyltransferase family 2 protein, partial [Candidatus Krumholzibacteria bacterium]|nr:glycosyltransferase family 2 protein [Candidatus Krumholzibacteria bacterium]
MSSIGAIVITRNEERNIQQCLKSLEFCAERVVVDSFSEDNTVQYALSYADKIYRRRFTSWGEQKNWALDQLDTDWALIVDADERVGISLAREIQEAVDSGRSDAFWIRRRNFFFGRPIRGAGWNRDRVLRLLRLDAGRYDHRQVHEEIRLRPGKRCGELEHRLDHFSYEDWSSAFDRMLLYSSRGAADALASGKSASVGRLAFAPGLRFWKQYLLQGGFRDGVHGLILCGLSASQLFLKLAKMRLGEVPAPPASGG